MIEGVEQVAAEYLRSYPEVQDRMDRIAKLIEGYEDPFGMELLSTVHWVMCQDEGARDTLELATAAVHDWNGRKASLMKPEHIGRAWTRLKDLKWDSEARSAIH